MNKAPDAFRTISEVAEELDLPQHVLRFWESRFPQIKPMKRGGGRRYYRPDDVDLLRGIRHLLYGEGYTIRGVQRILREQGSRFVQLVWQEGAPQPPRVAEDADTEAREEAEPGRGRSLLGLLPPLFSSEAEERTARAEPPRDSAPPVDNAEARATSVAQAAPVQRVAERADGDPPDGAAVAPALSAAQRERLQAALRDLDDCKRLLEQALEAA